MQDAFLRQSTEIHHHRRLSPVFSGDSQSEGDENEDACWKLFITKSRQWMNEWRHVIFKDLNKFKYKFQESFTWHPLNNTEIAYALFHFFKKVFFFFFIYVFQYFKFD